MGRQATGPLAVHPLECLRVVVPRRCLEVVAAHHAATVKDDPLQSAGPQDRLPPDWLEANLGGEQGEPGTGLRRHSIRQSSVTVSGQAALAGIQLLSILVLARLLQPSDFGLLAMVATLVAFTRLFVDFGLTQAAVQAEAFDQRQASGLFWLSAALSVALAVGTAALAPIVAWLYGEPELVGITLVYAAVALVNGLGTTPRALFTRQMAFRSIVASEVVAAAIGMFVAFGIALLGGGYWALVAIPSVRAVIGTSYLWVRLAWRPSRLGRDLKVFDLLGFGSKLSASNLANFFNRNADDVLVGWRWGAGALGQYAAAYRVLMLPLAQVSAPVSRIALPALARLREDPDRYREAYLRVVRVLTSATSPLMGFAAVNATWVVAILLGPGWDEAARILTWLALAGIVQPLSNSTGWLFVTQGRLGEQVRWSVVSAVLAVTSFVVGLPFGAVGVAAAYALSGLAIRFPLLMRWIGRRGPVSTSDLLRVFALPLTLTLVAMATSAMVHLLAPQAGALPGLALASLATMAGVLAVVATPAGRGLRSDTRVILRDLRRSQTTEL